MHVSSLTPSFSRYQSFLPEADFARFYLRMVEEGYAAFCGAPFLFVLVSVVRGVGLWVWFSGSGALGVGSMG
jgi:hypothetical protein